MRLLQGEWLADPDLNTFVVYIRLGSTGLLGLYPRSHLLSMKLSSALAAMAVPVEAGSVINRIFHPVESVGGRPVAELLRVRRGEAVLVHPGTIVFHARQDGSAESSIFVRCIVQLHAPADAAAALAPPPLAVPPFRVSAAALFNGVDTPRFLRSFLSPFELEAAANVPPCHYDVMVGACEDVWGKAVPDGPHPEWRPASPAVGDGNEVGATIVTRAGFPTPSPLRLGDINMDDLFQVRRSCCSCHLSLVLVVIVSLHIGCRA